MTRRLILLGTVSGLLLTAGLALFDAAVRGPGHLAFGLSTGMIGVAAGGIALVLALLMSSTSYWLASRNRAPSWRKRLLAAAVWTGAAGMSCGFAAATVWLAAGRPWFH